MGDGENDTMSSATKSERMFKHGKISIVAGIGDGDDTDKEVTGGSDGGKVGALKTLRA